MPGYLARYPPRWAVQQIGADRRRSSSACWRAPVTRRCQVPAGKPDKNGKTRRGPASASSRRMASHANSADNTCHQRRIQTQLHIALKLQSDQWFLTGQRRQSPAIDSNSEKPCRCQPVIAKKPCRCHRDTPDREAPGISAQTCISPINGQRRRPAHICELEHIQAAKPVSMPITDRQKSNSPMASVVTKVSQCQAGSMLIHHKSDNNHRQGGHGRRSMIRPSRPLLAICVLSRKTISMAVMMLITSRRK